MLRVIPFDTTVPSWVTETFALDYLSSYCHVVKTISSPGEYVWNDLNPAGLHLSGVGPKKNNKTLVSRDTEWNGVYYVESQVLLMRMFIVEP